MFIQTEQTPNPATLKFLPGQMVLAKGTAQFNAPEETNCSPLAARLFEIENVTGVFFGTGFISVTKSQDGEWDMLKSQILGAIMDHFISGLPVMEAVQETQSNENTNENANEDDNEIVKQIKELLDTRVRPAVAQDGGDITFVDFREGIVYLRLQGACSGCPSAAMTLKSGVETMLKHYVPEVLAVEPVGEYEPPQSSGCCS